jgi:FlaA1/EpsC-like NDP-sugar epimerase
MKEGNANYLLYLPHMHNENIISLLQFGIIGFLFYLNIYVQIIRFKQNNFFLRMNMILIITLLFIFSFIDSIIYTDLYFIFMPLLTLSLVKFEKNEKIPELSMKLQHIFMYTGIVLISLFSHWIQHQH